MVLMKEFENLKKPMISIISTTYTSHVLSMRERDENVEVYGAGGMHEKRN